MQTTAPKNQVIFEKWAYFRNGQNWPSWKGYSLCKFVNLGQKLNLSKTCGKWFSNHVRVVLCSCSAPKKHLIFEKLSFQNGQNWPPCKGFCKMVTLGQKLKFLKTCEKRFYNHFSIILCKKRVKKPVFIRKKDKVFIMVKFGHSANAIAFAKLSVFFKN